MKILILSTFENKGGAAVAAQRLYKALKKNNVDVRYGYVLGNSVRIPCETYFSFALNIRQKMLFWIGFILERLALVLVGIDRKLLYKFSNGNRGLSILNHPAIKDADVIHVHWTHLGMLSLKTIVELSRIKKVVWTYHDWWVMTGGCHLPQSCEEYQNQCNNCFYFKNGSSIPSKNLLEKKRLFEHYQGELVAVSSWMKNQILKSKPHKGKSINLIGNPIDTQVFNVLSLDVQKAFKKKFAIPDDKFIVTAGAADLRDVNKGFESVLEVMSALDDRFYLMLFGNEDPVITKRIESLNIQAVHVGVITDQSEMATLYNVADCYLQTSRQESLSYTTMESLSCGTPVVAFDAGGLRDLVLNEQTGFIVSQADVKTVVKRILELKEDKECYQSVSIAARKHILENYSEHVITQKYYKLYN